MSIINLPQLSTWESLTASERWHAGYLARQLEDSGTIREWCPSCRHQVRYSVIPEDRAEYIGRYALDSLLCALTHAEPVIAFRALMQAADYLAILRELKRPTGHLRPSYAVAQLRVEKYLQ